jgi:hypothetical protein
MGRVLIDDDHSGLGLGDDVVLVQLRAGGAEGRARGRDVVRNDRLDPGRGRDRLGQVPCRRVFGQTRRLPAGGRAQRGGRGAVHLVDARAPVSGVNAPSVAPATVLEARCPASASAWRRPETIRPRAMPRFAEPHLGFRRVHVHVHPFRWAVDEQRRRRVPVAAEHVHVGGAQRTDEELVAHRAPVDEEVLRDGGPPRIGRQRGVTGQADALALRVDGRALSAKSRPSTVASRVCSASNRSPCAASARKVTRSPRHRAG